MKIEILVRRSVDEDFLYQEICKFAATEYEQRYGVNLDSFPDIFVCAVVNNMIVGCFGAYQGSIHNPLNIEWYLDEKVVKKFSAESKRDDLVEIGTRAVNVPYEIKTNSTRLSVAMSAALLFHLFIQGKRLSLFTADRSVLVIAKQLNVNLIRFGSPDLSRKGELYISLWKRYFDIPRECFGLNLQQASLGCSKMCEELRGGDFVFEPSLFSRNDEESAAVV